MRTIKLFMLTFLSMLTIIGSNAQITPNEAIKLMARGINIGNTMETPVEGQWNPIIVEAIFDDYKNAGFTSVRIPIRWDDHTLKTSPYTVNVAWMNRVEQVIDWGLSKGLFISINAHHEDWIKNSDTYNAQKVRFDSIWSQIAVRFKDKSDRLLFEIINEPTTVELEKAGKGLTVAQIDELNKRVLGIIRQSNPTRMVVFSGNKWSNAEQLVTAAVPDTNDHYLLAYYHSYDPYPFGLEGPGSYGSAADVNKTKDKFKKVKDWSIENNIPVILGEFAAHEDCEFNSRMFWYVTMTENALNHGIAFNVWDDGGWFKILDRSSHKWNDIKDILIYTYSESPTNLKLTLVNDTNIMMTWTNRTTLNDSIVVERKTSPTAVFAAFDTIAPDASSYYDSLLVLNKNYYYRLRSKIKDSIEIYSYPITIKTVHTTALKNIENNKLFSIQPNPATSFITVNTLNLSQNTTLEIFDLLGKLKSKILIQGSETRIPLDAMDRGVYFFRLSNSKAIETHKIILQ